MSISRRSWRPRGRSGEGDVPGQAGIYKDKTDRTVALVKELGGDADAQRAALLAKCDLTTDMVKEFTDLQGIVGGLYARAQGENEAVATAIYDHYKPLSMEDSIPSTRNGQIAGAGRQARYAARLLQCRLDPERVERSVRTSPRGAGRREDSGRRRSSTTSSIDLVDGELKRSCWNACSITSARCGDSSMTK